MFSLDESLETFEIMWQWALESGLDISEVDSDGDNVLHLACAHLPEAALFMFECSDKNKFGLDRNVLTSMVNTRDSTGELPIDILKRCRFPITRIEKLTLELEKYTENDYLISFL